MQADIEYVDPGKYRGDIKGYLTQCAKNWATSTKSVDIRAYLSLQASSFRRFWNLQYTDDSGLVSNVAKIVTPLPVQREQQISKQIPQAQAKPARRVSLPKPNGDAIGTTMYTVMSSHWTLIITVILIGLGFYGFDYISNRVGLVDPLLIARDAGRYVSEFQITLYGIWAFVLTASELFIQLFWYVLWKGFLTHPTYIKASPVGFFLTLTGLVGAVLMFWADTYYSGVALYGPGTEPPLYMVPITHLDILIIIGAIMPTPVESLLHNYVLEILKGKYGKA